MFMCFREPVQEKDTLVVGMVLALYEAKPDTIPGTP